MIGDLKKWTEIGKGIYRYDVVDIVCFEIHIKYHAKDTDILAANASLYMASDWSNSKDNLNFFERKLLLNGPVMACLEKADFYLRYMIEQSKMLVNKEKGVEIVSRESNYEKCNGCPYYYGEIDQCMVGEDDVPDNLERKCKNDESE